MIQSMPKVELHAHLSGSISEPTLARLILTKSAEQQSVFNGYVTAIDHGESRTLEECFAMFKLVHQIVDDHKSIYQATCDVIDEFAADGVMYLELRSTPRPIPAAGVTLRSYMDTVLKAISDKSSSLEDFRTYKESIRPILVRYIASIDRRDGPEHAQETVSLAIEYKAKTGLVVGVDLSGNYVGNDGRTFIPALQRAQQAGLKLALHLAETDSLAAETQALLDLPPDRIGHGTFIHPAHKGTEAIYQKTLEKKIPLELCLTSNVKGQTSRSYAEHHFGQWFSIDHPICICTDDKGVFSTTLSHEYQLVSKAFQLTESQLVRLAYNTIDHIAESDDVKSRLRQYFDSWKRALYPEA